MSVYNIVTKREVLETNLKSEEIIRVGVKSFEDLDLKDLSPFYKGFERI